MIDDPHIDRLRQSIDALDQQILTLLTERCRLVLAVGERKRELGFAVYDPAREKNLLERLSAQAEAPLEPDAIKRIFESIVAESRRVEQAHVVR